MRSARLTVLLAFLAFGTSCASTEPKVHDLTGFWSGTTSYSTDPSCSLLSCAYDSRMMIVQTGNTVEGWYRARANIFGDETPIAGTVRGDTLAVLINSGQLVLVGAVKFRILPGGESLEAVNNGNTFRLALEK